MELSDPEVRVAFSAAKAGATRATRATAAKVVFMIKVGGFVFVKSLKDVFEMFFCVVMYF